MSEIQFTSTISVEAIDCMGSDQLIAHAARVSTAGKRSSEWIAEKELRGLINYLMSQRHGSCFEHSCITFRVHAPIFVWREWHRHRTMSFNEESGRYKQLDPVFWIPRPDRKMIPAEGYKSARPEFQSATQEEWEWLVEDLKAGYVDAYQRYEERLRRGYAKEVARAGLPVAIYSSCYVTCNPRALMNFLSLRVHDPEAKYVSYPQAEIEEAARAAETIFSLGWPITHECFVKNGRVAP